MAPFWQGPNRCDGPAGDAVRGLDATAARSPTSSSGSSGRSGAGPARGLHGALAIGTLLARVFRESGPPCARVAAAGAARRARLLLLFEPDRAPWFQSCTCSGCSRWDSPRSARWQNLIAVYSVLSLVQYCGFRSTRHVSRDQCPRLADALPAAPFRRRTRSGAARRLRLRNAPLRDLRLIPAPRELPPGRCGQDGASREEPCAGGTSSLRRT